MRKKKNSTQDVQAGHTYDNQPVKSSIGWLEGVSKKDAITYAKSFVERRFDAKDLSFYNVMQYKHGYLYEVHEGGDAVSYLPDIINRLSHNDVRENDILWFPCGGRAFRIIEQDNQPVGLFLPQDESDRIKDSGAPPLIGKKLCKPVVRNGFKFFIFGATIFAATSLIFLSSAGLFTFSYLKQHEISDMNISDLPYNQWDRLSDPPSEHAYATALRYSQGVWSVDWYTPTLEELEEQEGISQEADALESDINEIDQDESSRIGDEANVIYPHDNNPHSYLNSETETNETSSEQNLTPDRGNLQSIRPDSENETLPVIDEEAGTQENN